MYLTTVLKRVYSKQPFKVTNLLEKTIHATLLIGEYKENEVIIKQERYNEFNKLTYKLEYNKLENICPLLNIHEDFHSVYTIMPKFDLDLQIYASDEKNNCEIEKKKIMTDMTNGLHNLNNLGLNHYDIKLENFLLCDKTKNVFLCDFQCLAYSSNNNLLYPSKKIIGTESYKPPEVNLGYTSDKSDIWSLGVCFFNLLTNSALYYDVNEFLYRNGKIPEFNLSKETIDLLKDMLEINPLKRIDIIEVGCRLDEINRFYK